MVDPLCREKRKVKGAGTLKVKSYELLIPIRAWRR
jgi:hypothetical protein